MEVPETARTYADSAMSATQHNGHSLTLSAVTCLSNEDVNSASGNETREAPPRWPRRRLRQPSGEPSSLGPSFFVYRDYDHAYFPVQSPQTPNSKAFYAVYTLEDVDGVVRYVGMSRDPNVRLGQHCYPSRCSRPHNILPWLASMRAAGRAPIMRLRSAHIGRVDAGRVERATILHFLAAGAPLFNGWPTSAAPLPLPEMGERSTEPTDADLQRAVAAFQAEIDRTTAEMQKAGAL